MKEAGRKFPEATPVAVTTLETNERSKSKPCRLVTCPITTSTVKGSPTVTVRVAWIPATAGSTSTESETACASTLAPTKYTNPNNPLKIHGFIIVSLLSELFPNNALSNASRIQFPLYFRPILFQPSHEHVAACPSSRFLKIVFPFSHFTSNRNLHFSHFISRIENWPHPLYRPHRGQRTSCRDASFMQTAFSRFVRRHAHEHPPLTTCSLFRINGT